MKIDNMPATAHEARILGQKRYYTGKPCKNGHMAPRLVSNMGCCKCQSERVILKYKNNPNLKSAANKKAHVVYRKLNTAKLTAKSKEYLMLKAKRMPKWANRDAIISIYKEARKLTVTTGVLHHVDHIVPLRGKNVCGLHVEYNLRVIQALHNLRKGNRTAENDQ